MSRFILKNDLLMLFVSLGLKSPQFVKAPITNNVAELKILKANKPEKP